MEREILKRERGQKTGNVFAEKVHVCEGARDLR